MIGSLRGTVIARDLAGEVLLEVGGVGYRVGVPVGTLEQLEVGSDGFLYTHLHVREDALILYGFTDRDERDTFETLIGVNGVGPKLALATLSVHRPADLRRIVHEGDTEALALVSGIGKRTAQRLMVELKGRFNAPDEELPGGHLGKRAQAREALAGLGYANDEIAAALVDLPLDGSVETLVRDALRSLGRQRAAV